MVFSKRTVASAFIVSCVSISSGSIGHTIVKETCPSEIIYKFDRYEFTSGVTKTTTNRTNNLHIKHHESSTGIITHEVKIVDEDNPDIMNASEFEGFVFYIAEIELDKKNDGKEFLITDKPSARGYRYSIMNGSPMRDKTISLFNESFSTAHKNSKEFWSLPESYYPMFSDLNNDGQCEIINFSENFQKQFVNPDLFVSPNVYSFDSIFDKVDIEENLNADYAQKLWNDQIYKLRQLLNLIKQTEATTQFHSKMPEFDGGISANKFLYCAVRVDKFDEAVVLLHTLMERYNNLEVDGNWYEPAIAYDEMNFIEKTQDSTLYK